MGDILTGLLTGVGGEILSLIGAVIEGDISQKQFKREMKFKEKELASHIALKSRELGISESRLRQEWNQFVIKVETRKEEFAQTFGLETEKFGLESELGRGGLALSGKELELQEELGKGQLALSAEALEEKKLSGRREFGLAKRQVALQEKDFDLKKFKELVQPAIERNRRSKNVLQAFSRIASKNTLQASSAPMGGTL